MAYRDDHGHFVSKQEDGKKCNHDFETGFRSVFEERGIKVEPKEALSGNKNKDVSVLDEYGLVKDESTLKEANNALIKEFGSFPNIDSMSNKQFNEYADFLKEKYSISGDDAKDMLAQIDEYLSKKSKQ